MCVLNLCWFMTVDYNSVLHQCLSAGHINNYWQNSSCQIKLTDGRWGGGVPHVQSSLSEISSHYSQKLIKYKTDAIYHGAQLRNRTHASGEMSARAFIYTFHTLSWMFPAHLRRPVDGRRICCEVHRSRHTEKWAAGRKSACSDNKKRLIYTFQRSLLLTKSWKVLFWTSNFLLYQKHRHKKAFC